MLFKNPVRTSKGTPHFTITKINWLTLFNGTDIVRFIKAQRIKWLGNVQRMDTSRIAKRILEWKPMGNRPLGRPRLRWLDDVCDDLKVLKVRNWKELAMDKKAWNDLSKKDKTHKGL
jgi:hypothetical protein